MIYQLNELTTIKRGGSPRPITDYISDIGYPWLKISDFNYGQRVVNESHEYIIKEGLKKTKLVPKGTLIVTNSASPGIPIFLGKDMCLHDGFLYFDKISNKVNSLYLYYFLMQQRDYLKSQGNGSIFVNLKKEILERLKIDLPNLEIQNHIVNTIGSVDDLIENYQKRIAVICNILDASLRIYTSKVVIEHYNPKIIKSGITKFDKIKTYIDTSTLEGINNISDGEVIDYNKRPSRANMQPIIDSVWFAKMKESNKKLILTNQDTDLIDNIILSTGFLGILASEQLPLSFLSALVISKEFNLQRDLNSVGTTMAGINNETFLKILVPLLTDIELKEYELKYRPYIAELSLLRRKINQLKKIKAGLLSKYF